MGSVPPFGAVSRRDVMLPAPSHSALKYDEHSFPETTSSDSSGVQSAQSVPNAQPSDKAPGLPSLQTPLFENMQVFASSRRRKATRYYSA